MAEIQAEQAQNREDLNVESKGDRKWAQIYSYSYSQSLTECVKQLEQLIKYTKEIVGEKGYDHLHNVLISSWRVGLLISLGYRFDPIDTVEYEDLTRK
jgi:hypothetical protein